MSSPPPRPRGKPRGFRRDRDCMTCKAREVKCDLNRPICGPCRVDNVACQGYRNRIRWADASTPVQAPGRRGGGPGRRRSTSSSASPPSSPTSPSCSSQAVVQVRTPPTVTATSSSPRLGISLANRDPCNDSNWATHHEQFLDFFELKFEQAVSSLGQGQAGEPPVKRSLAGVWRLLRQRMSRGSSDPRSSAQNSSRIEHLRLQLDAVRGLGDAIRDGDILAIFGVVTLGFLDVYEGPFGDWQGHVRGARALVAHACRDDRPKPDGDGDEEEKNHLRMEAWCRTVPGFRQVVSLVMWWDLWNAFLNKGRVLAFTDRQRACMDPDFFSLVDCPPDTFGLFVRIVQCVAGEQQLDLAVAVSDQLLGITRDETSLSRMTQDAWRYAAVMAALALPSGSGGGGGPGGDASSSSSSSHAALMQTLGDNICRIVAMVSPLSGRYRMLSGPIAVLGATSGIPGHVRAVEHYWSVCDSLAQPIFPHGRGVRPCIQTKEDGREAGVKRELPLVV